MWIKNNRIIIDENNLEFDIECLEKELKKFFENDPRFCNYDIGVFVELDEECWNEDTGYMWNSIDVRVVNFDKVIELGGLRAGEKVFATAFISCSTNGIEPQLTFIDGVPNFYYVFDISSWGITNSETWENNRDEITVEDIIVDEVFGMWEV